MTKKTTLLRKRIKEKRREDLKNATTETTTRLNQQIQRLHQDPIIPQKQSRRKVQKK